MTPSTTRFLSEHERHRRLLPEGHHVMLCPACWGSPFLEHQCEMCAGRGEFAVKDVPTGRYL